MMIARPAILPSLSLQSLRSRPRPASSGLKRRLGLLLLCVALLFVQTLAQLHRTSHGVPDQLPAQDSALSVIAAQPGTIFQTLFGDHQDIPKCQLFDGVGSAQALLGTTTVVEVVVQGHIFFTQRRAFVSERLARYFQARAPPEA